MTKKGCCCKEENPFVKHYVAIKCDEYVTKQYKTVGVHTIFNDFPSSNFTTGLGEPHFPFTVTGLAGNGLQIAKDGSRRIKLMLRGAGGGAPRESYGGNGAYIDFNLVPFSTNTMSSMSLYVGRGGPGGIHTDFSTTTINPFGGGGGFPLAGWGGGAVAYGDSVQSLQAGGQYVVGSGAGAGAHIDFDTLFGGHGGVDTGIPGDGTSPGNAAIQTEGGGGGAGAGNGFARVGGYGFRFTPSGTIPVQSVGGGGGAGYFGGGGGGPSSSGGGGSSTKFDVLSNKPIDQGFYGTGIGPGSRCSPFFERTTKDSGIGANNLGRYLKSLGTGYISNFNGQPGQAVEYHRTRWCPCTESQTSNDATGVFPNGPNYICLTEDQYNLILSQTADLPDYNELFNAGATNVKLSFVLNGQRYLLTTWDDDIYGDPLDNYYCTLGCEAQYMANGTFSSVKWFVPTTDVFANYADSRNFFQTLYENAGIDLSTVTTCCDIFIGERICRPPNFNCANSTNNQGNQEGCFCANEETPPKYKAICRSAINVDTPFIAIDIYSQYYYLCIPASGWRRFGSDAINTLYNFFDGINPDNQIDFGNTLRYFSQASSFNIFELQQELCDSSNSNITSLSCNSAAGGVDECGCRVIFFNEYGAPDPEGINGFMTFIHNGAKLCARNLYGMGGASCCEICPKEAATEIPLDSVFSFNACTQRTICQADCWNPNSPLCNVQDCGVQPQVCGTPYPLTLIDLFAYMKKTLSAVPNYVFKNLYKAGPLLMDEKTLDVNFVSTIPTDPCDGGIPTQGCFGGNFSGFKADIKRTPCISSQYVDALCCTYCGCQKERCVAGEYTAYDRVIVEHQSYQTLMCVSISATNEKFTGIAMRVSLDPCLFSGLDPTSALLKAQQLVELSSQSYTVKLCAQEKTVTGIRIRVCRQCVDLVGAPISSAASIINACTAGYATATVEDNSGWYGTRVMTCTSNCCGCESYQIKAGDSISVSYIWTGTNVVAIFSFESPKYDCCVTVRGEPVCDTNLGDPTDCYTFYNGGKGNIYAQFRSTTAISYPEWKNNSRWSFTLANQENRCDTDNPISIGLDSCTVIECSNCNFYTAGNDCSEAKACCSANTGCGDGATRCEDLPPNTGLPVYCSDCAPYTCCSPGDYTDCEINGLGPANSACSNICVPPPQGSDPPPQKCPIGCACAISQVGQPQQKPCITDYGSLSMF